MSDARFDFGNSTFHGVQQFGDHSRARVDNMVNLGGTDRETLDVLRDHVDRLVGTVRAATDSDDDETRWRTEELAEVLADDRPDPERVRSRWSRLQPLVQPLAAAGAIAEITGLVQSLV